MLNYWSRLFSSIIKRNLLSASIRQQIASRSLSPPENHYLANIEEQYVLKQQELKEKDK